VAESSSGGLLSAALLSVPGASTYLIGGAVVYAARARRRFTDIPDRLFVDGTIRSSSEPCARLLTKSIRERFGTDWGLAETGAAGPTGNRYSDAAGHGCVAVAGAAIASARTLETARRTILEHDLVRALILFVAAPGNADSSGQLAALFVKKSGLRRASAAVHFVHALTPPIPCDRISAPELRLIAGDLIVHQRYHHAAIDAADTSPTRPANHRPATLWADSPFALPGGRLAVAVRLDGGLLLVRVVDRTTGESHWRRAVSVLTDTQARAWTRSARFSR
jgi:nicotinamide-nucleotide amidase